MAISTSSYFSNSIQGIPQVAGETVDIFTTSSTPKFALGTEFTRQDGAKFSYSYFAETVSAGTLMASMSTDVNIPWAVGNTCTAPSSTYQMPDEPSGVYPGSLGSRYLVVTKSSTTAGDLEGGYFQIVKGPGMGHSYRIRTNTSSNDPATGLIRIQLYDQIVDEAVTTGSNWQVVGERQNDLVSIDTATGGHANAAGWTISAVSSGTYGWTQLKGVLMARIDSAAMTVGVPVTVTTSTAGRVAPLGGMSTANQKAIVGYCVSVGSASMMAGIMATLN